MKTILLGIYLAMFATSAVWAESDHATTEPAPIGRPRTVDAGAEGGDWSAERAEMRNKWTELQQLETEKKYLQAELRLAPMRIDDPYSQFGNKHDLEYYITASMLSARSQNRDWQSDLTLAATHLRHDHSAWDRLYNSIPPNAPLDKISRRVQSAIFERDPLANLSNEERKQIAELFGRLRKQIIEDGVPQTQARLATVNAKLKLLGDDARHALQTLVAPSAPRISPPVVPHAPRPTFEDF